MAPAAAVASRPASASTGRASGAEVDLVRSYLRDIGRVPLLSHQQEITLGRQVQELMDLEADRKSTRLNSSHKPISYAVFCLKKKKKTQNTKK